jgi:PAS domain S-box-containing protein
LNHRLDIQRQDEVGRTALAFNQMAAQLRDRAEALRQVHDELETRIQERTAALAAANQELRTEIEERMRAEQALRESEQRYRTLFETAPVSIFTRDREGCYTSINTESLRYWTTNPVGHTLDELLPAEQAQEYRASDILVMETGRPVVLEQQFPAPHGLRTIFTHKVPLRDGSGNITGILGASLDITERRQAENALHEAELKYRQLVEQLPVITYTAALDEAGTIMFISPQLKTLGFSPEAWMTNPDHWLQYLHPDDFERTKTQFDKVRSTGGQIETEYRIFTPDGRLVWIRDEGTVVSDAAGQPLFIQGVMLDITQQKQAEEALYDSVARIRLIADHLPALIAYVDDQQIYRFANKRFEEWYVTGDIGGKHLREIAGVASYEGIQQYVETALAGTPVSFEYSRTYPDGRLRYVQISYIPHFGPAGNVLGFFTLVQDLTERKQAEEQIKASLEEKVVLLKEIHHRVKNNLQVISSLLYLQNAKTKSSRVRDILQDSQNRVKSMALIHEKLYQAKDLAHVDLAEYVRNLTGYLGRLYTAQASNVQLKVKVDNVFLGIDTAMPCGLIINELVSNSFKHAFPNSRSGQIAVELQADQERDFVLYVRDNGVGFPTSVDFRSTSSLGLQLVNTLVRQLNGSIELHRNGGVEFMIRFTEVK